MDTSSNVKTPRTFLKRGVAFGVLLALLPFSARAQEIVKGQVNEKVTCIADATQSYALFVPSYYRATRSWPVLYCFDPGADGLAPVERLKAAAEKYGYIVAGSNNSRNGPWAANVAAITAMVNDVTDRYDIDARRIYVAGLSGGARVAGQLGTTGFAKGVIGCSAGFMNSETPAKVAFPYFGTAGVDDFNYHEMRELDRDLDARGAPHRIVIFQGGHEWAPEAVLSDALAWMELQAMRAGVREKDTALIQEIWQARVATIPAQPALEQYLAIKSIAADFKGLADTAAYETKAKDLAGSRELKDANKAEAALDKKVGALFTQLSDLVIDGMIGPIQRAGAAVRVSADKPEGSAERTVARRVIGQFSTQGRDTVRHLFEIEDYQHAAIILEMLTALRPDRAQLHYDLARAYAWRGDKKEAFVALERAVANGFNDAARAEQDQAFARLRSEAGFRTALAKIKK